MVRWRSASADTQLQSATGYVIHGEILLRQNRWVVQRYVRYHRPEAYPPSMRGERRQKRPSFQKGFAREKGVDEMIRDPGAVKPNSSRHCQRSTSVFQGAF